MVPTSAGDSHREPRRHHPLGHGNSDREINANKPDNAMKPEQNKTHMLIDMAIPSERSISMKMTNFQSRKVQKRKSAEHEDRNSTSGHGSSREERSWRNSPTGFQATSKIHKIQEIVSLFGTTHTWVLSLK